MIGDSLSRWSSGEIGDVAGAVNDDDSITLVNHGFSTGQAVVYSAGQGAAIGGINEGQVYYVIVVDEDSIALAETHDEALADEPEQVGLSASGVTGASHAIASVLRPAPAVDGGSAVIDLGRLHGLSDGDLVVYDNGGGVSIGGLTHGATYRVLIDGATLADPVRQFQLAEQTTPDTAIALDPTVATGTAHRFGEAGDAAGTIATEGDILVKATNTGYIVQATISATVSKPGVYSQKATGSTLTVPVSKTGNKKIFTTAANKKAGGAFSGTVAVNVMADLTRATINDALITSGGAVEVKAIQSSTIFMMAGALTFGTAQGGGIDQSYGHNVQGKEGSDGMAGALAVNVVSATTEASIANSTIISVGSVGVDAASTGTVVAAAISAVGAAGSLAVAGTVGVNVLVMSSLASIEDSVVYSDADVGV